MADRPRGRSRVREQRNANTINSETSKWSTQKLHEELDKMGIYVPLSFGKTHLRKLYLENVERRGRDGINTVSQSSGPSSSNESTPNMSHATAMNTSSTTSIVSDTGVINSILNSMQTMQQTMMGLQQTAIRLSSDRPTSEKSSENSENTIQTATEALSADRTALSPSTTQTTAQGGYRFPISQYGVPSECLPHIDIIPEKLKKKIWEGKDVNLASLLIPKVDKQHRDDDNQIIVNINTQEDPRLSKSLSISEFITAFGKYKRVMCMKFPDRRVELDRYEANIVEISNVYGAKFYDYHCQFSARAASALLDCNIKIDWAIKDVALLQMVTSNAIINECQVCKSTTHSTEFCPKHATNSVNPAMNVPVASQLHKQTTYPKNVDRRGRARIRHNNVEVCNNFNENKCIRRDCPHSHVCTNCFANNHGASSCKQRQVPPKL